MTLEIPHCIGPSRGYPYTEADRIFPPSADEVPRPFNIQHHWRQPVGRSTGGAYVLADLESMTWTYTIGTTQLYTVLTNKFEPSIPWVWVRFLDPKSGEGVWYEATMKEPTLSRGIGQTVQGISIDFFRLWKYSP